MCLNSASISQVQTYYNSNFNADVLNSANPTLGISNARIVVNQGVLNCSFTRDNSNSDLKYFNTNAANPYVIVGYGILPVGSGIIT